MVGVGLQGEDQKAETTDRGSGKPRTKRQTNQDLTVSGKSQNVLEDSDTADNNKDK